MPKVYHANEKMLLEFVTVLIFCTIETYDLIEYSPLIMLFALGIIECHVVEKLNVEIIQYQRFYRGKHLLRMYLLRRLKSETVMLWFPLS